MASIGDLFLRLLLDDKGFVKDVEKSAAAAGDKAGQTMGKRLSSNLGTAMKAGLGLLAGAAGIATKGLLELENVTADFTAATGASADEAKRASDAILAMSRRNMQPLAEIGDALAKVHTDLGLTGDAAAETTERFLRFARATRQDAGAAVLAFDDILDNWGLTAGDAQEIMDKLIVSHQKFGGSIEDNQKTLAALAPAMRAANFEIDDGIALLGLFGAKGLDAQVASAAFAKALTKVKSPEELQRLIAEIAATEDPFKRAALAADLFGARAGAKLANALGGANIDDFTISVEEAAGATEEAAAALDNTFGARVQLMLKNFTGALVGVGKEFGPVLTGLASLASLGGALGLDKVLSKAFGGLARSSLVKGAVTRSGAVIGVMFSTAMFVGNYLVAALETQFTKLRSSSRITGAVNRAGDLLGSTLGKAASAAFAALLLVEVVNTYNRVKAEVDARLADLKSQLSEFTGEATEEALLASRQAYLDALGKARSLGIGDFLFGVSEELETQLAIVEAEIATRAATRALAGTADKVVQDLADARDPAARTAAEIGDAISDGIGGGAEAADRRFAISMAGMQRALDSAAARFRDTAMRIIAGYYEPIELEQQLQTLAFEEAELRKIIASSKSTEAQKRDARDRLLSVQRSIAEANAALTAATGVQSKQANSYLATLQEQYRTATGKAREYVGSLIKSLINLRHEANLASKAYTLVGKAAGDRGGTGGSGARAEGGPVMADGSYWVGERGPELFRPTVSGYVHDAETSQVMAGGGDTTVINVPVSGMPLQHNTPADIAAEVRRISRLHQLPRRGPRLFGATS